MCNSYIPLHCHSFYSLLDGMPSPKKIAERAKEIGSPAIAITDHGNIFGIAAHHKACKKLGIKPISGVELYLCEHDPSIKTNENNKRNHLTILAKNPNGIDDLIALVSATNKPEWFYRKPRIDLKNLTDFSSKGNLLCLSGCLAGELSESLFTDINAACLIGADMSKIDYARSLLKPNWENIAEQIVYKYQKAFGKDNYYIELQEEGMIAQKVVVECLRKLASSLNIPSVATLDSHYLRKEDAEDHRILLYSQMHTTAEEQDRIKKSGGDTMAFFYLDEFYIYDYSKMKEHYTDKEIEASLEIGEKITTKSLSSKPCLPKFTKKEEQSSDELLKNLCIENAKKILSKLDKNKKKKYWDRLQNELNIIEEAKLADYFLIVWDICRFIDENNGPRGKGRGSGAGSLVNYLLNVTQIDPLEYDLYFERFYNASRNIPPHFDVGQKTYMEWSGENIGLLKNREILKEKIFVKNHLLSRINNKNIRPKIEYTKMMQKEAEWIDKNNPKMWFYINDMIKLKPNNNISNSHLAYGLGMTIKERNELDPNKEAIKHEGHVSLPDIDLDIGIHFRSKALEYIINKWGEDYVAQMITFGRLQGKAALKEVFRAQPDLVKHLMQVKATKEGKDPKKINITPFDLCNEITQYIPDESSIADELQAMRKESEDEDYGILNWSIDNIEAVEEAYKWYKPLFDQAMRIEGTKKSQSKHAAGVIIADKPIIKMLPLAYDTKNKNRIVGVEMSDAEEMGGVKFDLLGISALDKCWYCADLINGIEKDTELEEGFVDE